MPRYEGNCTWCTLYNCKHNTHFTEKGRNEILRMREETCFMDLFHRIRPDSCYNCLISKDKRQLIKIQEMIRNLQLAEKNEACYEQRDLCTFKV